jgi:redox-sensitive bicupin YhaK (pirin superfamily)
MGATPDPVQNRDELRSISRALQELHRTLLDYQRRDYEKHVGRIGSDFYVLQLAAEDPQFAWLRALSSEMIRVDELVSGKEPPTPDDLALTGVRIRYLLTPSADGNSFQSHYDRAMQTNPDIIMAHAAAMRSLPPAVDHILFRSAVTPEQQRRDTVQGHPLTWQPGALVPGHGDHGYRALSMVTSQVLPPGGSGPEVHAANEELLVLVTNGTASFENRDGASIDVQASRPLAIAAGTGLEYRLASADEVAPATVVQVWLRPAALGGEPTIHSTDLPVVDAASWRPIAGPEENEGALHLHNNVVVSDIRLPSDRGVKIPARDGWDTFFAVLEGDVEIDGIAFPEGSSGLVLQPSEVTVNAVETATIVAFQIDPRAKITRAGRTAR